MAKKNKETEKTGIESIEETLSKTEQYIEKNQRTLTVVIIALIVIVGGYIGYKKLYLNPLQEEAISQSFAAEQYFEKDSFNLALNGDGNMPGFLDIIDEYGSTKTGNLANYYAGICYLNLSQFEEAIDYLESFSTSDALLLPVSIAAIGDAYMELGDTEIAIQHYVEAAQTNSNDFTSPIYYFKLGRAYEIIDDYQNALDTYELIKKEYPEATEARMAEKYITQARLKAGVK